MGRHRKDPGTPKRPGARLSRTRLVEFVASADFNFRFPNASAAAEQRGRAGERCFTNLDAFVEQVVSRHADRFRVISNSHQIKCLPPERWSTYDFSGKRVLFLLPSHALGANVPVLTFIQSLEERFGLRDAGVFCTGPTHDIYLTNNLVTPYPIWIPKNEFKRWNVVIDLGHLETRQDIDIWPIDMEADLLAAFDLEPSNHYTGVARPLPARDRRIGILPLASSPLRTLPVETTKALVRSLMRFGQVTLCLNRNQHQGMLYRQALGEIDPSVETIDVFDSIGALLESIQKFDYAVFADSGPAHMSKLFGTAGVAVYTSAPGDVLQGRFKNLTAWTVPYSGDYCQAPCGLARVRATANGTVGCMGSLKTTLDGLPNLPRGRQPDVVKRLLLDDPVPCIAHLRDTTNELVEFVIGDLAARIGRRPGTSPRSDD